MTQGGFPMAERRFIKALSPVQDTEEQLRHHILWLLMIRVVLFTLLIAITAFLQAKGQNVILPPLSVTLAFLSVVFIYSIGSVALLQNKSRRIRRFGLIQLLSDTMFAAVLVFGTGCSQSIFTSVFIFPVIAGGLILYRIGGLIPAAAATILLGIVLTCEYLGFLPPFYAETNYVPLTNSLSLTNIFAVYGVTFFTMALLSGMLAGRLRSTEEELSKTSLQFDRLSQLYKQIFDDIRTGIITIDDENTITSYNSAAEKISGFPGDQIIGQSFGTFFPDIILTDSKKDRQVADLERKDGNMIRVGYSFARLNLPTDTLLDEPECSNCKVITMQDISQVEKMEQQVRGAEKMAAIGELSAAIAHDFRNPLAAISGSAQLLAMDLANQSKADSTTQSLNDIILRESNRMAQTITDFLQFARPTAITPEWFDLARMAEETVNQITSKNSRYQGCTIVVEIPDQLFCWADRQQLQIILSHLLENSCTASSQTLHPVVITAREDKQQKQNVICIQVIDQGPGITEEIREHIFTPFYSTREDSTGLGLSIVKQLLGHHDGEITILDRKEGAGCIVEICLPLPSTPGD
ncbi:MAG: PAS domain S-box protein [Deltaproteobacteria bacterium]|nr:PAS domain S-box protein [Deltaproteobacteria bacterium]